MSGKMQRFVLVVGPVLLQVGGLGCACQRSSIESVPYAQPEKDVVEYVLERCAGNHIVSLSGGGLHRGLMITDRVADDDRVTCTRYVLPGMCDRAETPADNPHGVVLYDVRSASVAAMFNELYERACEAVQLSEGRIAREGCVSGVTTGSVMDVLLVAGAHSGWTETTLGGDSLFGFEQQALVWGKLREEGKPVYDGDYAETMSSPCIVRSMGLLVDDALEYFDIAMRELHHHQHGKGD